MRRFAIFLTTIPLLLLLAGCLDHHEWHQKLTVIIDTPNGEIKGSAVAKVNAAFGQLPMSSNEVNYEVAGEATIVDLGKGRYLFATIDEETKERFYRSDRNRFKGLRRGEWLYEIPKQKDVLTVPLKHYPMLVTFTDINNPASVKLVDPNDLDASFGCSVDGSSTSNKPTNSSMPWRDAGLTWHAYQKQKAEKQFEAYYKRLSVFNAKIATLKKKFAALHRKTLARNVITKSTGPSRIIRSYNGPVNPTLNSRLYISSGYKSKIAAVRKQRVALMSSFESRREAISAAPNKGRSTAKDCYSIKSITLEIADEPVTTGKVESVLGIEFFKKWGSIHKAALKRGLKDPYFKNFMSDLGRGYFLRTSK